MPKKKTAPKKTVTKKFTTKTASKEVFSTQTNFFILTLFCFFVGALFISLYK